MATLTTNGLRLDEVAKRKAPDGSMNAIVDALMEENQIIEDAIWREANDTFSNKGTRWVKEPSGAWRKLNKGSTFEKGETVAITDTIGILESWSENDIKMIDAFPNPIQARNDEAMSFVRGLGKTMASAIVYSNTITTPEQFTGIAPRLASIAASDNVINEGGTGSDLTSIFVIDWGIDRAHMLFPKNSKVGLQHKDLGTRVVYDSDGNPFEAYTDKFTWDAGFTVKNQKSIGRIANIETSGSTNIFDEDNLIILLNRMTKGPGRRIYVNETIMSQMQIRLKDKSNVNFSKGDGLDGGGPVMMFNMVPIRQVDKIIDTESALT